MSDTIGLRLPTTAIQVPIPDPALRPSGRALKVLRVAVGVSGVELAAAMGIGSSRLTVIEGSERTTPRTARRYLDALATCATFATSTAGVA